MHSDWLTLGHYSLVMPTGQLRAGKDKTRGHIIINYLLTSNIQSLWEKSQTSALLSLIQYGKVLVSDLTSPSVDN